MPLVFHGRAPKCCVLRPAGQVAAVVRRLGDQLQAALGNAVVARLAGIL